MDDGATAPETADHQRFFARRQIIFPIGGPETPADNGRATAVFEGELSSPEDVKRADLEVKATFDALAAALKEALRQQSVFISYRDEHWCV